MKNAYLLEIVKALQPIERQEIAQLLTQPTKEYRSIKEMARLFQVILDAAPGFSQVMLQKDKVYFQIYADQNIVQGKLEKLMSDLNKFLRNYVLTTHYLSDENDTQRQVEWSAWLRKRGLAERAQKILTNLKKQQEPKQSESLEQYLNKLLLAQEAHEWECKFNQVQGNLEIPQLVKALDLYYYNYRTELANRYVLQQKAIKLKDGNFFGLGLDSYKEESILLQISVKILEVLSKEFPSVEETQELMQLLNNHEETLSFEALYQFYAYLRNSCTLVINNGNLEFIPILHEIHKNNLLRGYFFANGQLPPHAYLNLIQIATRAKEYEWARKFTEEYRDRIVGGDENQFYYKLNMAHCLFSEGKFEQALDFIPETPSSSHYYHILRRLEIKIYYELRSEQLHYKTDNFRKFIDRMAPKTIADNLRTMDLNFLNLLLQLTQTPFKDKARSARLIARIENKKLVSDRAWLIEKASELG
ncbi:MAG: hypothetical protein H7246_13225 [Phycisphaerae bacterium]|nr:hypothetical protein [Saprospiraceae bacterium]